MTKRWYNSTTIQNAIFGYLTALATIGVNAYERESITRTDIAAVLTATYALKETIQGRRNAKETIGKADTIHPPIALDGGTEVPDFSNVGLPLEEVSSPSESIVDASPTTIESPDTIDSSEGDIDVFSIMGEEGKYYIKPIRETKIKLVNKDSSVLDNSNFGTLEAGTKYPIESYKKQTTNSISVTFESEPNTEYFLFVPHIELYRPNNSKVDLSESTPQIINVKKTPINFPGYDKPFYLEDPIYPGSHFSWAEATKGGERVPVAKYVVDNIIKVAKELDKLRSFLGNKPMIVTSWYRDPVTNRRVGGATRSSHLEGHAVDIYVPGMSVWDLQAEILDYWKVGGVGKGAKRGFVHVAADGWYRIWDY